MEEKKNIRVFIVDDDPVYVKMLEHYITKEITGAEVRVFLTGEACIHEMHKRPDVVILDYFLNSEFPDAWNGIKVLKKISWSYPYTNVIMLSSHDSADVAMDSYKRGAYEYVIKDEKAFPRIRNFLMEIGEDITNENIQDTERNRAMNIAGIVVVIFIISLLLFR